MGPDGRWGDTTPPWIKRTKGVWKEEVGRVGEEAWRCGVEWTWGKRDEDEKCTYDMNNNEEAIPNTLQTEPPWRRWFQSSWWNETTVSAVMA